MSQLNLPRQVLPVIHHLDFMTSIEQADIAFAAGADGVFLISHAGADEDLLEPAYLIQAKHGDKLVGANFLTFTALDALQAAAKAELDMVWVDDPGIRSSGYSPEGRAVRAWLEEHQPKLSFFGSVAFKYQPVEPEPGVAALKVQQAGMVPTTSGPGTGAPPSLEKAMKMRAAVGAGPLAVASGMTPANVGAYLPYFTHYLVATGVSRDMHHFDEVLLAEFVRSVREQEACA